MNNNPTSGFLKRQQELLRTWWHILTPEQRDRCSTQILLRAQEKTETAKQLKKLFQSA